MGKETPGPPSVAALLGVAQAPPSDAKKEGKAKAKAKDEKKREPKVKVVTIEHQKAILGIIIGKSIPGQEILPLLKEEYEELKKINDENGMYRLLEAIKNYLSRTFKKQECVQGREPCFQCQKVTKATGEAKTCDSVHPTLKARLGYRLTCSDIKKPVHAKWGLIKESDAHAGDAAAKPEAQAEAEAAPSKRSRDEGLVDEESPAKKVKESAPEVVAAAAAAVTSAVETANPSSAPPAPTAAVEAPTPVAPAVPTSDAMATAPPPASTSEKPAPATTA